MPKWICQYCGEKGHFVSSCSLKKTQLKEEKLYLLSQKKVEKINNEEVKNVKTNNVFDILNEEDSSSSDEEEEEREVEVKSENVTIRKRKYTNWASVVDSDTESEDEE